MSFPYWFNFPKLIIYIDTKSNMSLQMSFPYWFNFPKLIVYIDTKSNISLHLFDVSNFYVKGILPLQTHLLFSLALRAFGTTSYTWYETSMIVSSVLLQPGTAHVCPKYWERSHKECNLKDCLQISILILTL